MNLDLLFESYMSCLLLEARDKDYLQKLESKGFQDAKEITDTLVSWNDPKKEKTALHFILNGSLDLSKDLEKFEKAYVLIDRQHLDFNKFNSLDEVLNRNDSSTERIKAKSSYDPDKEPCFSNKKDLGKGTVVYTVEDSREGQKAVRKAIDLAGYGPKFNGWCLIARQSLFSDRQLEEFRNLPPEQLEKLGYYDNDDLGVAWSYWKTYSAYPKRVAFKNGKLVSFSAGKDEGLVEWWNREDESVEGTEIPYCGVEDDLPFIIEHSYDFLDQYEFSDEELASAIKNAPSQEVKMNIRTRIAKAAQDTFLRWFLLEDDLKNWFDLKSKIGQTSAMLTDIASNRNASEETLLKLISLVEDTDLLKLICQEILYCHQDDASEKVIEKIFSFEEVKLNASLREDIALCKNVPSSIAESLVSEKSKEAYGSHKEEWLNLLKALAKNRSISPEVLDKIPEASSYDYYTCYYAIENPKVSLETLSKIYSHFNELRSTDSEEIFQALAAHAKTLPSKIQLDLLKKTDLSNYLDICIKLTLTSRNEKAIEELSRNENAIVRKSLANYNSYLTRAAIENLLKDPVDAVRKALAKNCYGLTEADLKNLAGDKNATVSFVAKNRLFNKDYIE